MQGQSSGLSEHLSSPNILSIEASDEQADVVAGLSIIEGLFEGFNAGDGRFGDFPGISDDINLVIDLNFSGVNGACDDSASSLDIKPRILRQS